MHSSSLPNARCSLDPAIGADHPVTLRPDQVASIVQALAQPGSTLWRTQRTALRYGVLCPALIWPVPDAADAQPIRAQLVDISTGGIGLLAGSKLEPDEPIVFETTIEGCGPVQWRCRLRWCVTTEDGTCRLGAQFTDVSRSAG